MRLPDRGSKAPTRVLLTTPAVHRSGGVAQYMRALRPHLPSKVEYFTIGSRSDHERFERTVFRMARDSWQFARTLRADGYDLVHLNPSIGAKALIRDGVLLLIAKALQKRVVVFAHGWDNTCECAVSKHLSWLFRLVYGRADAFIVLGNEFKRRVQLLGYDKPVFIEDAPLDDELLQNCDIQAAPRGNREGHHKFNILFLARVEKEKGIYEALETYRLLREEYSFVSLTVAGQGSELNAARRYVDSLRLPEVCFTGHVEGSHKFQVFRTADAYIFPSYSEGLPISVLEAMAFGLPVVTCAVGALRDLFKDGTMGFISESRAPEVLGSLLNRLIRDPVLCSTISTFNRTYARHHFTARRIAADIERIYRLLFECAN